MNNSYDEVNVTDNLFYNMKSHKGFICAPFYDGEKSSFAYLCGMKTKSDIPETIRDFICTFGATKGLLFYNTKVHNVESVQDILRQYIIGDASGSHLNTEGVVRFPLSALEVLPVLMCFLF